MAKLNLNHLYQEYLDSPEAGLESLLVAVRHKAAAILKDEDQAQAFVISVWQALDRLKIERSFTAWLQVRLRWQLLSSIRNQKQIREEQAPLMLGEDDEPLTDEEVLDILAYRHS